MRGIRAKPSESWEDKRNEDMRWKISAGAVLTVILLLFYAFARYEDGGIYIIPSLCCAVIYGLLSDDTKLAAFFGFLFYLAYPLAIILLLHEIPPPSALPYILLWGLVTALLGVIFEWIGRRASLE